MTSASPEPNGSDWATDVAGRIDSLVGSVRDKTTVPASTAARAVVYGLIIAVLGAALGILVVIGLIRFLDLWLGLHPMSRRVWVVDAIGSAIFLLGGMLCWRRRRPRSA